MCRRPPFAFVVLLTTIIASAIANGVVRIDHVVVAHAATGVTMHDVPDEVLNWNSIALIVTPAGGKNGQQQSRIYAMVHLAVHDAVNAIERRYEPYSYAPDEDRAASSAAAIATAARDVLAHEVPLQLAAIDAAWVVSLGNVASGAPKTTGEAIGHAAAAAMLALRSADGSSVPTPYTPGAAPGEWRPTPNPTPPSPAGASFLPAVLPGWGNVAPFFLNSGEQFRPDGPPSLASEEYARDFAEVAEIGAQFSAVRTMDQSAIARFWYEPSTAAWNRIARTIAAGRSLDMWEEARMFALIHGAMADGFIAGFNAKYYFNFWRPATAIREGDTDGNDQTVADASWNTFLNTPAIPDYPSTHSVLAAASARVLADFFGTDDIAFTTTSGPPFAGITRSYGSLSEAAASVGDSRVFAGIHFRTACTDGLRQGAHIGKFSFKHRLRPLRN